MTRKTKIIIVALVGAALGIGIGAGFLFASSGAQDPGPDLCELEEGRWCESCGDKDEPECPAGMSGWLCCNEATGVCVASGVANCGGGTLGWCSSYTEDAGTGAATCYD